jgi:hypothetical protein
MKHSELHGRKHPPNLIYPNAPAGRQTADTHFLTINFIDELPCPPGRQQLREIRKLLFPVRNISSNKPVFWFIVCSLSYSYR